MSRGGIYAYRTRKPSARFRIPIVSYHWGYVGRTSSFYHRHLQHTRGESRFGAVHVKPWTDLEPHCYRLPLPNWKWLHVVAEALMIWALMPVYNDKLNRHNPRRIPIVVAIQQRARRDAGVKLPNIRPIHVVLWLVAAVLLWYTIAKVGT